MINTDLDDERVAELLEFVRFAPEGFANNTIWRRELACLLAEVQRLRDRPTHCPCCDGDHL